jgi:hypothetical protein
MAALMRRHNLRQHIRRTGDPLEMRIAQSAVIVHRVRADGAFIVGDKYDVIRGMLRVFYDRLKSVRIELLSVHCKHLNAGSESRFPRRRILAYVHDLAFAGEVDAQ